MFLGALTPGIFKYLPENFEDVVTKIKIKINFSCDQILNFSQWK